MKLRFLLFWEKISLWSPDYLGNVLCRPGRQSWNSEIWLLVPPPVLRLKVYSAAHGWNWDLKHKKIFSSFSLHSQYTPLTLALFSNCLFDVFCHHNKKLTNKTVYIGVHLKKDTLAIYRVWCYSRYWVIYWWSWSIL